MIKSDEKSNANSWELEIVCKNKEYLDEVVKAILKYGCINFEVENIELIPLGEGKFGGRYSVLMWCSWFSHLSNISDDLKLIEENFKDF
jgi:hypothetical protein